MDLWDVVRLMVRRWYIAVPLLLLTVTAVAATAVRVSPNHTAEGHVMVLPPSIERAQEEGEDRVVNPFDTEGVAAAIITRLRNRNLADEIRDEGYQASWEVDRDIQFLSVIGFKVTAATEHEAQEVVGRLLQEITRVVDEQQDPYNLPEDEKVTTVTLGSGENVEVVRGNQVRAMVVVFAAFLILTMGGTIAFDAVARRRAAGTTQKPTSGPPSSGRTGADLPAAPVLPAPAPAMAAGGKQYTSVNGGRPAEPAPAASGGKSGSGTVYSAKGSHTESDEVEPDPPGGKQDVAMQAPIQVSYRPPPNWPVVGSTTPHEGQGGKSAPPAADADDSTIVLPLSGTRRSKTMPPNGSGNGQGPREADRPDTREADGH